MGLGAAEREMIPCNTRCSQDTQCTAAIIQTDNYSPSWEKLNLVPEGDVMLDPDENGELAAVSCSPPAEWDRSHSFASS